MILKKAIKKTEKLANKMNDYTIKYIGVAEHYKKIHFLAWKIGEFLDNLQDDQIYNIYEDDEEIEEKIQMYDQRLKEWEKKNKQIKKIK